MISTLPLTVLAMALRGLTCEPPAWDCLTDAGSAVTGVSTLILTGLNQQLITFTMLVGDESRAIQQQAATQSALEWGAFSAGRCSLMYSANRDKRNVFVCVY